MVSSAPYAAQLANHFLELHLCFFSEYCIHYIVSFSTTHTFFLIASQKYRFFHEPYITLYFTPSPEQRFLIAKSEGSIVSNYSPIFQNKDTSDGTFFGRYGWSRTFSRTSTRKTPRGWFPQYPLSVCATLFKIRPNTKSEMAPNNPVYRNLCMR